MPDVAVNVPDNVAFVAVRFPDASNDLVAALQVMLVPSNLKYCVVPLPIYALGLPAIFSR